MDQQTSLITEKEIDWIRKYVTNASPTGGEQEGQRIWRDYIKPYADEIITTLYGNVAAVINPGKDFKVVIEAHADEIAWFVNSITSEGFIHVEETGGTDPGIAPSQIVRIHTEKNGIIEGIFGWPAIHTREVSDDAPKKKSIFIDCGCDSKEEVENLGIQVGDFITYKCGFNVLNKKYFFGRALDNRMGGFVIARAARMLKENNIQLPYSLYVVNAVQEEVGAKGAEMIAATINPDCTIVIDVTHDTSTPMMNPSKEGKISAGKGPVITKAPPVHSIMRKMLIDVASRNNIPVQLAAVAKSTGTDTDSFAYANGGIPSALISFPLRYMHTTVETVHRDDVENTIKLLYHALQEIKPGMKLKYLE